MTNKIFRYTGSTQMKILQKRFRGKLLFWLTLYMSTIKVFYLYVFT